MTCYLTVELVLITPFLQGVWNDREVQVVEGRELTVVSRAGLLKMKRAAGRKQDLADIEQLGLE